MPDSRTTFLPTARQTNWILVTGFTCLGYALYLRYLVIEQSTVGIACEGGLRTWLCLTRQVAITLFTWWVFGALALGLAVLNLIRPMIPVFAISLAATAFGIVLYNVGTSSLAAALLMLSFARAKRAAV